jgi:hypothetical protein
MFRRLTHQKRPFSFSIAFGIFEKVRPMKQGHKDANMSESGSFLVLDLDYLPLLSMLAIFLCPHECIRLSTESESVLRSHVSSPTSSDADSNDAAIRFAEGSVHEVLARRRASSLAGGADHHSRPQVRRSVKQLLMLSNSNILSLMQHSRQ